MPLRIWLCLLSINLPGEQPVNFKRIVRGRQSGKKSIIADGERILFNFIAQIPGNRLDQIMVKLAGMIIGYKGVTELILSVSLIIAGCGTHTGENAHKTGCLPAIEPDYINVTIPPNIAPMNFQIREEGKRFLVVAESDKGDHKIKIRTSTGKVRFSQAAWKRVAGKSIGGKITIKVFSSEMRNDFSLEYDPFYLYVASDKTDPYLVYRLIYPGYYCWSDMRIEQRCIENFREKPVVVNRILDMNCINCHSFSNNQADRFMVHIRGSKGGTYIFTDGKLSKHDLKIDPMPGGATYPAWHPSGRYIAFSSNQVRQVFYAHSSRCIEVFDLVSDIIVYDTEKNSITMVRAADTARYLATFPGWSRDGRYLYFCRALHNVQEPWRDPEKMELVKYSLVRIPFDAGTGLYGEVEMIYDAASEGGSVSFPRISPDGNFLVFTLARFGTFPNWHRETDLYMMDMRTRVLKRMDINSDETESWHEFSSNGRWLVFSSKRLDGRSTRPFYAYIDAEGNTGKPFVLPQKNPVRYRAILASFNIPEPVNGKIRLGPWNFRTSSGNDPVKAVAGNLADSLPDWEKKRAGLRRNPGERPVHE